MNIFPRQYSILSRATTTGSFSLLIKVFAFDGSFCLQINLELFWSFCLQINLELFWSRCTHLERCLVLFKIGQWAPGDLLFCLILLSRISARGPFGEPPVSLNKETRVVMFCQGTGIVPFMPMLQDLLEEETETIVSFIFPPTMSFLRRLYRSPWFTAVQVLKSCFSCQILMSFAASGISISEFSSPLGKFWLAGGPLLFTDVYKSSNFESKCLGTTLKSAW